MQITPYDKLNAQTDLHSLSTSSRKVTVLIPTFTNVNYDADTDSGNDISAANPSGRTVTWTIYQITAALYYASHDQVLYGQVPPAVNIGDSFLVIQERDKAVIKQAEGSPYAYVMSGGNTYRITSLDSVAIGQSVRWSATLETFNPTQFRATGY